MFRPLMVVSSDNRLIDASAWWKERETNRKMERGSLRLIMCWLFQRTVYPLKFHLPILNWTANNSDSCSQYWTRFHRLYRFNDLALYFLVRQNNCNNAFYCRLNIKKYISKEIWFRSYNTIIFKCKILNEWYIIKINYLYQYKNIVESSDFLLI